MDKTDKQAVYDIAAKLGYTGDEGPSVASAIYAVAQARGYEGACEGDASQALQALYTVVGGGGGGGDLGALQVAPLLTDTIPAVNGMPAEDGFPITTIRVGSSTATFAPPSSGMATVVGYVAAGLTLAAEVDDGYINTMVGYVVTTDDNWEKYLTVEEWDGTITKAEGSQAGSHEFSFVMPTLDEGEYLVIYATLEGST